MGALLGRFAWGADPEPQPAYPNHFQAFLSSDGLAGDVVRSIAKAPDGDMWFACWGRGVSQFDGYKWTTYREEDGLKTKDARVLFLDRDRRMWCGTTDGIHYFDGHKWVAVQTGIPGLEFPSVFHICQLPNKELWFGVEKTQILRFTPQYRAFDPNLAANPKEPIGDWSVALKSEQTNTGASINSILPLDNNEVWVSIAGLGVLSYRAGAWAPLSDTAEEKNSLFSLARTDDGTIWGAGGSVLVRYRDGARTVIPLENENVQCLAAAENNMLYAGTSKGLRYYDGKRWGNVESSMPTSALSITTLKCINEGELWAGTRFGVWRITRDAWNVCNAAPDGTAFKGLSLYTDPQHEPIALSNDAKVYQWDGLRWQTVADLSSHPALCLGMTHPRNGRVWVLFADQVVEVSIEGKAALQTLSLPRQDTLRRVYFSPSGRLFVYGVGEVFERVEQDWRLVRDNSNGQAFTLAEDDTGSLWLIWSDRLERQLDGEWRLLADTPDGPVLKSLECISEMPDTSLLFGIAEKGVYTCKGGAIQPVCSFEGALSTQSYTLLRCLDGTLWVGNRQSGISSYRDGLWVNYGQRHGVVNGRVLSLGEGPQGIVWAVIEGEGVLRYQANLDCPKTRIEHSPVLVASGDRAVFNFSGKDKWQLTPSEDLRFSWRVVPDGEDESHVDWGPWRPDSLAIAPRLAPGRYKVQVRACNLNRNADPVPAEAKFEVQGPFWREPLFYIPVGGLALVVIALSAAWLWKHRLLVESESKYREILNSISEIIFSLSREGVLTYVSPGITTILGFAPEDALGKSIALMMHAPDAELLLERLARLSGAEGFREEYRFVTHNGESCWLRLSCQAVTRNGNSIDIKGVATDITKRRRAEEALTSILDNLETIIQERTQELLETNQSLMAEIEERRRAEEALRESEAKYRDLVENIPQRIFIKDRALTYVSCNERFATDLKLPPDGIAGRTDFDFFPRALAEKYREDDRRVLATEQILHVEDSYPENGEDRWVHTIKAPVRDATGTVVGVLGIFWDITDHKHAEIELARYRGRLEELVRERTAELDATNALLQSELVERKLAERKLKEYADRIHDLYEHAPCGYHSLDSEGIYIHVNETELSWLGYSREELEGKMTFGDLMTPESREAFNVGFPAFKEVGWAKDIEFTMLRKDGSTLPVVVSATTVTDSEGNYVMSRTTMFDLTERRRMEAILRRTMRELAAAKDEAEAADRLKTAFLATMSHELRTPLNSIIGFAGILYQELSGPLNADQKKQLAIVQDSSEHLLNLINDVLDISKIEAGQLQVSTSSFDLRSSIEKIVQSMAPLAKKKSLTFDMDVDAAVGEVTSDRRRVEQILLNLIGNAIKFTERGGIRVECSVEEREILVRIRDTGIGIRPEDMDRLFKPFQQVDSQISRLYEGTGLGLSICKKLVELLGGAIWADSEWGAGSVFSFTLPVEGTNR